MSFSGLALSVFLLGHMSGNLLILVGDAEFNEYAHFLTKNQVFLIIAEVGLLSLFIGHILVAVHLTRTNRLARPIPYHVQNNTGRSRRSLGSSWMILSGTLIIVFMVIHLLDFKFGTEYPGVVNGVEMRDLAKTVRESFSSLPHVILYVVAMIVIGIHLWHGFRSAFETLGVVCARWDSFFLWMSRIYVIGVMGGFVLIPLCIYLCGGKG